MKIFVKIIVFMTSVIVMFACTEEIEFKGNITNPYLVVHSYITPDELISTRVTISRFLLDKSPDFEPVNNAEVLVYVNGTFVEKMENISGYYVGGKYQSAYKPSINDTVKIIVKTPDMKDVSSETHFIKPCEILSIDTTRVSDNGFSYTIYGSDTIITHTDYKLKFGVTFKDNESTDNYYRLIVRNKFSKKDKFSTDYITTAETYGCEFTDNVVGNKNTTNPVTGALSENTETNEFNVFSDELINGKKYALNFTQRFMPSIYNPQFNTFKNSEKIEVFVSIQSISKEYFYYLKSREASLKTNFFSEPVQIRSNINGGIGCFGSYTSSNIMKIEVK